jgi:hypothetical protein
MSESRRRKSLEGVARSRRTDRWRATSGWSTTVTPVIGADAISDLAVKSDTPGAQWRRTGG